MSAETARAYLDPRGFKGHSCAFCGTVIPISESSQIPMSISTGGKVARYWAHRECFRERLIPDLQPTVERILPASTDDIFPARLGSSDGATS